MSCGLFKNTNHHRLGLIAMMVFALLGCGKGAPATNIHPTPTANQVFAEFDPHLDTPKTALNLALNDHLSNERYSVVNYYRQTKPLAVSPLDKNADTLWESVIKMGEYQAKTTKNSTDAYLTHDEYFAKDGLYLRYYDEKNNTLPQEGYELSRSAGLENSIQYADKQVQGLAGRYKSCVTEMAHDIDELVRANPAITTRHPAIKSRLDHLDTCLKQSNDAYVLLFENLTAYQALDLDYIKGCTSRYRTNLRDALAKNRAIARYEGGEYDVYETVYGNFAVCYAGFEMGYRLDPVYYTESAYTYEHIEQIHQNRLCALQNRDEQESLSQNHQSYATDPKAHTTSFYRYFECLDRAVLGDDGERESVLPVSIATAYAQYELYKEWLKFKDAVDNNDTETSWLDDFFAMKQQPQDKPKPKDTLWGDLGGEYGVMADGLLKLIKKTPEQALAKNLYQHNNTQITLLSHHRPQDKAVSAVLAMEFDAPTATQKLTVPFYADFKNEKFVGDVSPVLPVLAVIDPKNTPIFEQIPLGKLQLPQELSVVPLTLFYDALQKGYVQAMADLPSANFSQIVPATAPFGERFGATQVIKLTLGSKELGQMVGAITKQLEHELSAFIDAHPEQFNELDDKGDGQDRNANDVKAKRLAKQKALKDFVKKWAGLNQGYQTGDVASAVQLVETVLPIGLGQSHYFYLNKGKLVAHVRQTTLSQALTRTQDVQLMVAQFDKLAFDKHALSTKLPSVLLDSSPTQSSTPEPFALNDWLKILVAKHGYLQSAKMARLLALQDEYKTKLADEQDNETSDDKNNQ